MHQYRIHSPFMCLRLYHDIFLSLRSTAIRKHQKHLSARQILRRYRAADVSQDSRSCDQPVGRLAQDLLSLPVQLHRCRRSSQSFETSSPTLSSPGSTGFVIRPLQLPTAFHPFSPDTGATAVVKDAMQPQGCNTRKALSTAQASQAPPATVRNSTRVACFRHFQNAYQNR